MKIFQKEKAMGEVLKFVTPHGGLRKKNAKKFLRFWKNNSNLRSF